MRNQTIEQRIKLQDTYESAIIKLSEGNPGAVKVCATLLKDGSKIDPQAAFGGLHNLLDLDAMGIYGSNIWVLFKDVCGQDLIKMIAVLRSWQLGITSEEKILNAIHESGALNLEEILEKVREQLPEFAKED